MTIETYDAMTTRGDNPQTWVGPSNAEDHPFNRPFEDRYDWAMIKEGLASLESANRHVNRHLDTLGRERDMIEFQKSQRREWSER